MRGYLTIPPEANVKEGTDIEVFDIDIPSANEQNPWFIGVTGSCGGLWQKVNRTMNDIRISPIES